MKQTNERLCALAQKGDAAALDSLINFINACDDRVIYGVFSAVKRNVLMPDRGFNIFH